MPEKIPTKLAEMLHALAYDVSSGEADAEYTATYLHRMAHALTHLGYMDEDGVERRAFPLATTELQTTCRWDVMDGVSSRPIPLPK